jgi:AMMECR1 domain-containing protein
MSGNSGLLLPQVATEYGWDRTTFLEQTCIKAGLPYNAYLRPEATIYRFQAQVFGEAKAAGPIR